MKSFDNKVAAVTGAASGIGRALALDLAKRHCHLALSDVDAEGLSATADMVMGMGVQVTTDVINVADRDAVHAWADKVVQDQAKLTWCSIMRE